MKTHILIATTFALLGIESAYATCAQLDGNPQCDTVSTPEQNIAHCKSYSFPYALCFKNEYGTIKKFHACKECEDGYILALNTDFIEMGCAGHGGVYVCKTCAQAKSCDPYSETKYDPDAWNDSWTGYQVNTWTECNTATCEWEKQKKYRCAAGYYGPKDDIKENYIEGFGVMGMSGCTRCPSNAVATKFGESDPDYNETLQSCYLVESNGYDLTGVYDITPAGSRCYHD